MRIAAKYKYIPLVVAFALSGCASKPPMAYVQKSKPEPISQNFEGNFCVTQNNFLTGGTGITRTVAAYHQAVGKCLHPRVNKDELDVIYFGEKQDQADKNAMYAELEESLQPHANAMQATPAQANAPQSDEKSAATIAPQECGTSDCNELDMLAKSYQLHFASDSDVPANVAEVLLLEKIASVAKKHSLKIAVIGHADSSSTEAHNAPLSMHRAEAVARTLKTNGLSDDMMIISGHSASEPLATNETPEGRALNRRVEVKKIAQKEEGASGN